MAGRLTGNQHSHLSGAAIQRLMLLTWRDLDPFTSVKDEVVVFDFQGQLSFEHEEKLAGMDMGVAGLTGTRRHKLFDDAEFAGLDEVPAVAIRPLRAAPFVVLGRFRTDDPCWHSNSPEVEMLR
jgi:hypothetical protein